MYRLLKDLEVFKRKQIWLAVSGGVDSMVLLDMYAKAYHDGLMQKPKVLHVNHQIHPDAHKWAELVQKVAKSHDLEVLVESIEVGEIALEENARILRYQAMFQHMGEDDLLLTAHHLDDQKETFFFRALRGTGIRGLVGIRKLHTLYGHKVFRPFYQTPKSEIDAYAKSHQLEWIEDPSNQSTQYKRNEIRQALSNIKDSDTFVLTQMHLERQSEILDQLLAEKLNYICVEPHIMCLDRLKQQSIELQLELFHYWIAQYGESLSYHRTQAIFETMINAKEDRYPEDAIGGYTLLRYRNVITLLALPKIEVNIESSEEWIELNELGKIHNPKKERLQIKLLGSEKGKYKKKLQSLNIPLWLRPYIPLINGKIKLSQWEMPKKWQYWFYKPSSSSEVVDTSAVLEE